VESPLSPFCGGTAVDETASDCGWDARGALIEREEDFALAPGSWAAGGISLLAKEGFSEAGGDIFK
jgi:hypothetical protein